MVSNISKATNRNLPQPFPDEGLRHHESALDIKTLDTYDTIIVFFSGGKDSIALVLHLLELGVKKEKIELWHHRVDGTEGNLFEWPCTEFYSAAFAKAFGLEIFFSWRHGGLRREMHRKNERTAPVIFEDRDHALQQAGGIRGKLSTRRKFPQVSPDLSVRYCSSVCKIDVASIALCNQERFKHSRTLVLSGERGEESEARAKYKIFEPDRADNRKREPYVMSYTPLASKAKPYTIEKRIEPGKDDRHIDRWRPIRDWEELEIWNIMERNRVRPHPAYILGFGRVSCAYCIFANNHAYASAYHILPEQGEELIAIETSFGYTMKRNISIRNLIESGQPFPAVLSNKDLVEIARSRSYPLSIILPPGEQWVLPAGAFKKGSCGPK